MSAPEDLLERIRLRLDESFVGIGEVVAELQPADVADLVNQLTRQEAAAVMSMLAVPRAVEVFDQPTLNRRSAILAADRPRPRRARSSRASPPTSAPRSSAAWARWHGAASLPKLSAGGAGRGRAAAAVPAPQRGRHHDHRVRAARPRAGRSGTASSTCARWLARRSRSTPAT